MNFLQKTKLKKNLAISNKGNDYTLSEKFINLLMVDGKKVKAYNIFYETLKCLEEKNMVSFGFTVPTVSGTAGTAAVSLNSVDSASINKQKNVILALNILFIAVLNVKPSVEVRKVRKGAITYLVPAIVPIKRQETLAIRWLIEAAKNRKKKSKLSFAECLAIEFTEAYKKLGKPRQRRDDTHKLAESNRAYIRFRWW